MSFLAEDPVRKQVFRRTLLRWFDRHRRPLPWRVDRDPYRVWVSEIMLQQTRAAVVGERYAEFLARFPNVEALARVRVETVLAAWSGLGYYRRARALHQAARRVVEVYGGRIPETSSALEGLPGIGRYTAAAIASIAFGERSAVVDGNVRRVLQRLLDRRLTTAATWRMASQLLSARRPGDFNQAMMELGATICLPGTPRCTTCPVRRWCASYGKTGKAGNQSKTTRRQERIVCALLRRQKSVFLVRRPITAPLMPGMWELPVVEPVAGSEGENFSFSCLGIPALAPKPAREGGAFAPCGGSENPPVLRLRPGPGPAKRRCVDGRFDRGEACT
jgi:A/G-specific adenine glycosylase